MSGLSFGSPEEMPPGLRRLYEQSVAKTGQAAPQPKLPVIEAPRPSVGVIDGTTPKIMIFEPLPDLNTYIDTERRNKYKAASMKKSSNATVSEAAHNQLGGFQAHHPVRLHYLWVMPDARKDLDNVAFAHKFVQDGLVAAGILAGDSQKYVIGFDDNFMIDPEHPRVEVTIEEVPDGCVPRVAKLKPKKRRKPR